MLICLALGSFFLVYGKTITDVVRTDYRYVRGWNTFHYYLGAKYFQELGYFDLYGCALAADRETDRRWPPDMIVRDLRTYQMVRIDAVPPCPRGRFSAERWASFRNDVALLLRQDLDDFRLDVVWDKGYNATPVGAAIAAYVANRVSLGNTQVLKILFNLDLILLMVSLLLVARVFDSQAAALMAIFSLLFFGTYQNLAGNFLQYLWLFFVICGVCAWQAKRMVWSGLCLASAVGLHLFPLLLLSGMLVRCAGSMRAGDERTWRHYKRFFLGFGAALATWMLVAELTLNEIPIWSEFIANMKLHGRHLSGEVFNIGLRNLVATIAAPNVRLASSYMEDYVNVATRLSIFEQGVAVLAWLLAGLFAVLFVIVARKRTDLENFAVSIVMLYALLNLSPYYYLTLGLVFLPCHAGDGVSNLFIKLGALGMLALHVWLDLFPYVNFIYSFHLTSEIIIAAFVVALLSVYMWSDLCPARGLIPRETPI
jgi:hypothetical protein